MTNIDTDEYQASPRSTDPADLLIEARIAIRYLKEMLAARDREVERLQAEVNAMYREAALAQ
ncbi:hypothetical protein [Mycolicibacterium palauense]|uniref:hypothetical protein n=1 Tax=Mycolicibacterium palauense TaxID=2034511 RepID=UPI001145559D|nr:hypothetical protein [Mycolicibacterium palauense]